MGNAAAATAEKGHVLVEHAAQKLAELLAEVDRFPLATFETRTAFEASRDVIDRQALAGESPYPEQATT